MIVRTQGSSRLSERALLPGVLAIVLSASWAQPCGGTEPDETAPETEVTREAAPDEAAVDDDAAAENEEAEPLENPCDLQTRREDKLVDETRVFLFEAVCNSARWLDDFFGNESFRSQAHRTHGRFGLRLIGDEMDGVDGKVTFRADFGLPNVERRLNLFLDRESEEQFFSESRRELALFPDLLDNENDRKWLLGVGYDVFRNASKGFDVDAGIEVRTPLEPYVRGRYRHYWLLGQNFLARTRYSAFWRNQQGLGAAVAADVERPLGDRLLARLSNQATIYERSEGAIWYSGVTLFHSLSSDRALSYQVGIEGETDALVTVQEAGARVTYRQRMLREWLFGEVLTGVAWRRPTLDVPREPYFFVGFGFEMFYSYDRQRDAGR